jgi:hypothetical protein
MLEKLRDSKWGMDRRGPSERDICTKFITPALHRGGRNAANPGRGRLHQLSHHRARESAATSGEAEAARAEAIAYFVSDQRVRREILDICDTVLHTEKLTEADKYWVRAMIAEAWLGLGNESAAEEETSGGF